MRPGGGAYNDASGITAAFNLNLLERANRELGTDFDTDGFAHRAVYNENARRIEMHLVSVRNQTVTLGDREFRFSDSESIVTEHSYKYTVEGFQTLAARAGFHPVKVWTDPRRWFSVHYFETAG